MVLATLFGKCCKTNGSSNIMFGKVGKPMVLATLVLEMLKKQWFEQHCFRKCGKHNGSSNIVVGNVVKPIVLATLFLEMM